MASNGYLVRRRRKQENSDTSEYFFSIHSLPTKGNAYIFINFQTTCWEFSFFSFWQTFPAASWTHLIFLSTVTSFRQLCSLAAPYMRKYLCFELVEVNSFLVWLHIPMSLMLENEMSNHFLFTISVWFLILYLGHSFFSVSFFFFSPTWLDLINLLVPQWQPFHAYGCPCLSSVSLLVPLYCSCAQRLCVILTVNLFCE